MRETWRGSSVTDKRLFAGAIKHAGNLAAHAHPAGVILVARSARLRF